MSQTDDVWRLAKRGCPDLPRSAAAAGVGAWHKNSEMGDYVQIAEMVQALWRAGLGGESAKRARRSRPIAGSELLLEAIREDMEATREEIFGSTEPPFDDYQAAIKWVESQLAGPHTKLQKQSIDPLLRHAERVRQKGVAVVVKFDLGMIDYVPPGKPSTQSGPIEPGSPLARLKRFLVRAEIATGLTEPELVIYALTPVHPVFPRYRLRKHTQPSMIGDVVRWTVLIYAPDLTWEEMREIHRAFVEERRKRLLSLDEQVLRRVRAELGEPPKAGRGRITAYWEEFRTRCERWGLVIPTWDAARNRWKQLERTHAS
ncbi:hypothetical protein BH18GEM1_BH18GEM1_08210 [soil metagenome]